MTSTKKSNPAPQARLEASRRQLADLAAQCGEEVGLHRPLHEVVGGVAAGISEDADLAQALADRQTSDSLIHLLDQNREQVEHALERLRAGAYGICEVCGRRIPADRLSFQPASTRCVECQALWDRDNVRTA
ncbi:MAG TPA: TraR/DksA C4-type zinc finger protein [Patescibacteria group bacterium]|nr:TraR/DksA C4-type zinc finger protein [Patescibacteria group bacterium]